MLLVWWFACAAVFVGGPGAVHLAAAASAGVVTFGTGGFEPLVPERVLDTRDGTGVPAGKVKAGGVVELQLAGRGGVPALGAGAVALNVVSTDSTTDSFVTVWPSGVDRPLAANLNVTAGQTVGNLVIVKLGVGGKVSLYNLSGATHLVADVQGWFPEGGGLAPMTPTRLLDTRDGTGVSEPGPVGPAGTLHVQITGRAGIPASGVGAVVLNVAVTQPTADSYLTVYPSDVAAPLAASLNFVRGQTVPNLVIAKVGADGAVDMFNYAGSTHVVADVAGWFPTSSGFEGLAPARLLDTRDGTGVDHPGAIGPGGIVSLQVAGRSGVPATGVGAVVVNIAVTEPTADSYVTAWPSGVDRPLAANLNMRRGQTVPNLVIAKVGADGKINLFNFGGSTHLVADVTGWFPATPTGAGTTMDLKSGTVLSGAGDVVAVTGSSDTGGTVVLAGSADLPAPGGHLAVLPNPIAPHGLVGSVTSVAPNADGTSTVVFASTMLTDAFNNVQVHMSAPFDPDRTAASSTSVAGRTAAPPGAAVNKGLGFDCQGSGGVGLSPSLSYGFGDDVKFDLDLAANSIEFSLPLSFTVGLAATFEGKFECTVSFDFVIPIEIGEIEIKPQLSITVSAALTVAVSMTAAVTFGFSMVDGHLDNLSSFVPTASGKVESGVQAGIKVRPELAAEVELLGLVGPKVSLGVNILGQIDLAAVPCALLTVQLTGEIDFEIGRWGIGWNINLASLASPKLTVYEVRDPCPAANVRWVGSISVSLSRGDAVHDYYTTPPDPIYIGTATITEGYRYLVTSNHDTLLNTVSTEANAIGIAATLQQLTRGYNWTGPGVPGPCNTITAQIRPEAGWGFSSNLYDTVGGSPVLAPSGDTAYIMLLPTLGYATTCVDGEYVQAPANAGNFGLGQDDDLDFECLGGAQPYGLTGECVLPVNVSADRQEINFHGTIQGTWDLGVFNGIPVSQTIDIHLTKEVDLP